PSNVVAIVGTSVSVPITLESYCGFQGTVALGCSGAAAGVTCSLDQSSIALSPYGTASAMLIISVDPNAPPGPSTLAINGSAGSQSLTASINLTIPIPDFSISSIPATLAIELGASGSLTILVSGRN